MTRACSPCSLYDWRKFKVDQVPLYPECSFVALLNIEVVMHLKKEFLWMFLIVREHI